MTSKFTQDQWSALLAESISTIESLSKLKGGEYASDLDRLANFRRNAEQTGVSIATIWSVYYNKHHDAVMQWVRDQNQQVDRPRAEPLVGRVDDMIVYLLLLKAILAEQQQAAAPVAVPNWHRPSSTLPDECQPKGSKDQGCPSDHITMFKNALVTGEMVRLYVHLKEIGLFKAEGWKILEGQG